MLHCRPELTTLRLLLVALLPAGLAEVAAQLKELLRRSMVVNVLGRPKLGGIGPVKLLFASPTDDK
jgi:hypothetical protein